MADLNHPKCFKLYDLFTKRLFICITYLSLEIQWCYFWCIILMLVCSLWKHLIWRQCCIMIFWHIDTSQGQASVELSSVLSFRHFVQCSDQLMTAPSHDGQVSVATTGPKAIFFFQTQATVSALTPQLFACCGLVIISWVFNKNSSVKQSVVHSCLFCFLGAAGVLVGHPFDTVKVGVCCILFGVCSLVTKNKTCSTLLTAFI